MVYLSHSNPEEARGTMLASYIRAPLPMMQQPGHSSQILSIGYYEPIKELRPPRDLARVG